MTWWQALVVALSTLIVTKTLDYVLSVHAEKRNFAKMRRELAHKEIEQLKIDVGIVYELAANWAGYENKEREYIDKFSNDHVLIGKFNKYPNIAQSARDAVHWCKIVAYNEREYSDDLIKNKEELGIKFRAFIKACDDYIEKLV